MRREDSCAYRIRITREPRTELSYDYPDIVVRAFSIRGALLKAASVPLVFWHRLDDSDRMERR